MEVADPDVREAAELVLPHRLRRQPFSDSEMDENKLEETFRKHQEELEQRRLSQPQPEPGAPAGEKDEVQLIGEVTVAPGATFPVKPLDLAPERKTQKAPGRRTRAQSD